MQSAQVYCVERVFEDLKKPFVAKDVVRQLIHLDAVVADVFERITLRVQAEKDRVKAIDAKIAACQAKVNAVTERGLSSKATTVFSTAKYPAPKGISLVSEVGDLIMGLVLPAMKGLYADKPYEETPPLTAEPEATHFLPSEPPTAGQRAQLMAEVVDLFERVNTFKQTRKAELTMTEEGLGSLPEQVPTVGGVLLFNSSETPYQNYVLVDNLFGTEFEGEEERKKALAAAPDTVINRGQGIDYSNMPTDVYRPKLGSIPAFSEKLPQDLPLPGLASTGYQVDVTGIQSIAPSVQITVDSALLPDFATGPTAVEPHVDGAPLLGPSDMTPPPPPPPPPSLNFDPQQPNAVPTDATVPPPPPPPTAGDQPPPPPPMNLPDTVDVPPPPPVEAAPANPRASLMDAIRGARLDKLKKVNVDDTRRPEAPKAPTSIPDEVKARLDRLNAAWSGKADREQNNRDKDKKVVVLTATEVPPPNQPPPPPLADYPGSNKRLPSVAISEDGSDDERFDDKASNFGEEKDDALARIKAIQDKQAQAKNRAQEPAKPPEAPKMPAPPQSSPATLDAHMRGLRTRQDSLSMSEASDWSDD
ncbi:carbon catabolite repressor protein [Achlya hypogyna]|uniref:Carbon catabolite repressor protein n=1 Tax=Achlya hypogyna TaxID=1202772 RepID=A0A1V9Z8L3_ACHHY|nr:carbon catabolite repressor protein [Achlya hypogyna]